MPQTPRPGSVRVFVHTRDTRGGQWKNAGATFTRVPSVGECFTLSSIAPAYEVRFVLHCAHDSSNSYDAEVYAVPADVTSRVGNVALSLPMSAEPNSDE